MKTRDDAIAKITEEIASSRLFEPTPEGQTFDRLMQLSTEVPKTLLTHHTGRLMLEQHGWSVLFAPMRSRYFSQAPSMNGPGDVQ